MTVKLTGADTGGALTLLETETPPNSGPPPHVHHREDEIFSILAGEFEFRLGDESFRAGPGSVVVAPRDIPHVFRNVSDQTGRLLILCQPAGFENFVAASAGIDPAGPPDFPRMAAIAREYGLEFLTQ